MPAPAVGDLEHDPPVCGARRHFDRRCAVRDRVVEKIRDETRKRRRSQRHDRHGTRREAHVVSASNRAARRRCGRSR
jgi:hypothetical protein